MTGGVRSENHLIPVLVMIPRRFSPKNQVDWSDISKQSPIFEDKRISLPATSRILGHSIHSLA